MAEYIEREAVVMELNKTYDNMNAMGAQFYCGFMNAVHRIKEFPAADVTPVRHARWEYERPTINTYGMVKCTVCNLWTIDPSVSTVYHYCPNCGAKMDG